MNALAHCHNTNHKTLLWVLGSALTLTLVGCIPSLHPLYTEKDLVFDPDLLGLWSSDKERETWLFEKESESAYKLIYTDSHGKAGQFTAHLLKLDANRFLDLYPDDSVLKEWNDFYRLHYFRVHTFLKVEQITPTLQLVVMDLKWFDELLKGDPTVIHHERVGDGVVVTAGTPELQAFVRKHLRTQGAWGEPINLQRKEKK